MQATIDGRTYDTDRAVLVDVMFLSYDEDDCEGVDILTLYAQGPSNWFVVWSEPDREPHIEPYNQSLASFLNP